MLLCPLGDQSISHFEHLGGGGGGGGGGEAVDLEDGTHLLKQVSQKGSEFLVATDVSLFS